MLKYKMYERIGQVGSVEMPVHAEIKHVDMQYGYVTFWAETDSDIRVMEDRTFQVLMTGDEVPESWIHLTTFIIRNGISHGNDFVGHVYEDRTQDQEFEDELAAIGEERP